MACGVESIISITYLDAVTIDEDDREEETIIEESKAKILTDYVECPTCYEGESRWIYSCDECGFTGCYDGVYENGCYEGNEDVRMCPKCDGKKRTKVGRVEAGSVEELEF
jgi:predicted nucleic acid binding AN1-type Zn finger protein